MKLQIILILLTTFVIFGIWIKKKKFSTYWFFLCLEICQSRKSKNNYSIVANTQKGYAAVKKFILKKSHKISKRLQRKLNLYYSLNWISFFLFSTKDQSASYRKLSVCVTNQNHDTIMIQQLNSANHLFIQAVVVIRTIFDRWLNAKKLVKLNHLLYLWKIKMRHKFLFSSLSYLQYAFTNKCNKIASFCSIGFLSWLKTERERKKVICLRWFIYLTAKAIFFHINARWFNVIFIAE